MDCSYDSERGRMTRPRLYQRCKAIGRRAGIEDVHPHRFRDTFAVDMLARGATPYDVAKLRERVRNGMETGKGIQVFGPQNTVLRILTPKSTH